MSYIPTIHTFEDDINENRSYEESPISGGLDKIISEDNILVSENKESSIGKKILIFISVFLILASIIAIAYYLYTQYKIKKDEALLNSSALLQYNEQNNNNIKTDSLENILPLLSIGISQYVKDFQKRNNIIILTIKENEGNFDYYSLLYSYILAHKKDLGNDLINAFELNKEENIDINASASSTVENENINASSSINEKPTTTKQLNNIFDTKYLEEELLKSINKVAEKEIISADKLKWEPKTFNNQDFEIANAGIVTLIYGYANNNKYLIFTTSIKDFLDVTNALN